MAAERAEVMREPASSEQGLPVLLGRDHHQGIHHDVEVGKVKTQTEQDEVVEQAQEKPTSNDISAITTHLKCCEKVVLYLGAFFALAQGVSSPAIAKFSAEAITTLTGYDGPTDHILDDMTPVLVKIAILAGAQFTFAFGWQTCLSWAASKQANRWHRGFMEALLTLDVAWYDENEPAGVAAKLETDIANVYSFMCTGCGYLLSSFAQFIAGLSLAFVSGWQLSLVVCATIPVMMCVAHRLGVEIEWQTFNQQKDFARASAVAEESMMAIRTVAAFGGEAAETARFEKELLSAKRGGIRSGFRIGIFWGGLNLFYTCLYGLALWFGGHVLMADERGSFEPANIVTVMIAMLVPQKLFYKSFFVAKPQGPVQGVLFINCRCSSQI